jgi:hypothetical protein
MPGPKAEMPPILLNDIIPCLVPSELFIVQEIVKNGRLRPSKPTIEYEITNYGSTNLRIKVAKEPSGSIAYLWAKLAYQISPYKKDLAEPPDPRRYFSQNNLTLSKRLDEIADMIYKEVPTQYRYGLIARGESLSE